MYDNQLFQILIPIISNGLISYGLTGINVKQSYQRLQQGADSGTSIYIHKLYDNRYGFLKRNAFVTGLEPSGEMSHVERQEYFTTFQVDAWAIQEPSDLTALTASDIINIVAAIMQSDSTLQILQENDLGILRVMDIRNPYFKDDYDQNESSASFEFTISQNQIRITLIDAIADITGTVTEVQNLS